MNQSRALHLLDIAKAIRHYENTLSCALGEKFNLFNILRVGHYEVKTHTPILADLLSPRGSHGQGAVFLRFFLEELGIDDFEADDATVQQEVGIGELGRLDITITEGHGPKTIIIENKIYAALQENQLERYLQYHPTATLIYLTLQGDEPPPGPDGKTYIRIKPASYRGHIINWLQACRSKAATAPTVRESLTMYINLLQSLTGQNTNSRVNKELINAVLEDEKNYEAFVMLRNLDWEVRRTLLGRVNETVEAFALKKGFEVIDKLKLNGAKEEGCLLTNSELRARNLSFGFQCSMTGYRDFYFGFAVIDVNQPVPDVTLLQDRFKERFHQMLVTSYWPAHYWWSDFRNWDDSVMASIISKDLEREVVEVLEGLAEYVALKRSATSA